MVGRRGFQHYQGGLGSTSRLLDCQNACEHPEKSCLSLYLQTTAQCAQMCSDVQTHPAPQRGHHCTLEADHSREDKHSWPKSQLLMACHLCCTGLGPSLRFQRAACRQDGSCWLQLICWTEKCPHWLLFLPHLFSPKGTFGNKLLSNQVFSAPGAWLCPSCLSFISMNSLNPSPGSWED